MQEGTLLISMQEGTSLVWRKTLYLGSLNSSHLPRHFIGMEDDCSLNRGKEFNDKRKKPMAELLEETRALISMEEDTSLVWRKTLY